MRWMSTLAVCASLSYALADPKPAPPEGEQKEPKYFYWHEDEKIPLRLDTTRLVFIGAGDERVDPTAEQSQAAWAKVRDRHPRALAKAGFPKDKVKPNDQFFHWEVDIADRKLNEQQVEQLIAQLAADEDTDFAGPVFYNKDPKRYSIPTRRLIVRTAPGLDEAEARRAIETLDLGTIEDANYRDMKRHWLIVADVKNGLEVLRKATIAHEQRDRGAIEWVDVDWILTGRVSFIPNDPAFGLQWGLRNVGGPFGGVPDVDIDADEAWEMSVGTGVRVLVLDSGVQLDHPDINVIASLSRDFRTITPPADGSPRSAFDNHGTTVAGVIAAKSNGVGCVGAAFGANVVSARIYEEQADGSFAATGAQIAEGIRYALSVRARVANSSFELFQPNTAVSAAYLDTRNAGVVHFAASGNSNPPSAFVAYPASLSSVAAVGAIDSFGLLAVFSDYGDDLDFVAPGVNIFTTDRTGSDGYNAGPNPDYVIDGDFKGIDGTSFACPHAAGVAALLLSWNRTLTPQQVIQRMRQTAADINPQLYGFGFDEYTGAGLINARAALNATPRIRRSDLNANGHVDSVDLTLMPGAWGPCPAPPSTCDADVNGDELVNSADLTMLLGEWT